MSWKDSKWGPSQGAPQGWPGGVLIHQGGAEMKIRPQGDLYFLSPRATSSDSKMDPLMSVICLMVLLRLI